MKKIAISILTLLMSLNLCAQKARDFFASMPDSLTPLLTAVNKADFIDFMDSNMKAEITNRFSQKSEMTRLTDDFIELKMSPEATWQLKVLPLSDGSQVVCIAYTTCATACDSHLKFFDDDWKELPISRFVSNFPTIDDFFTSVPDSVNANRFMTYRSQVDMLLTRAVLSPEVQTLTFEFTTPTTLDAETADFLKPYIREEVVYQWRDEKFQKTAMAQ